MTGVVSTSHLSINHRLGGIGGEIGMSRKVWMWVAGVLMSGVAFAQGERVEYEFTEISVDEPDVIFAAQAGLFIPGLVGYELSATMDDAFIRNTYFDLRYISTLGMQEKNSEDLFMNSMSEFKLRAGYGFSDIVGTKHKAVLDRRTGSLTTGGNVGEIITSLDVGDVPSREVVYYYGIAGQRDMPIEKDGKEVGGKSSYIGAGARWQRYSHYGINVKGYGSYKYQESMAYYAEVFSAPSGPYKGISVNLGYESRGSWAMFGAEIGATVAGQADGVELSDTVTGKAVFGVFLDQLYSRKPVPYDSKCWQEKRSHDCAG